MKSHQSEAFYRLLDNMKEVHDMKRHDYASKEEILNRLSKQMLDTFNVVYDHVQDKNITYRDACYGTALLNLENKFVKKYNL